MNRTVTFVLGMLTAAIIAAPLGIWVGSEMEQDGFIETIQSVNLSDQCLQELSRGVDEKLAE
ncbi:hypothetical protein A7A08_02813 [Methyloligella halotolerans]|uniref:Uncharacterized protein n=1 Tax=Methyloligella halotolerans TaxID=1177755 RepID=A0A1E2RWB5_9HYPH|nr:hypothetical protein [Methyloligella halotolerans]ODA66415.1 hypothetical protein A7A08_02813 [Methyloligella halotolerans]